MTQTLPIPQMGGFSYGYAPPWVQVNDMGQNSGANTTDPIAIPDLDDPKERERIRKGSIENLRILRLNESLSSLKNI